MSTYIIAAVLILALSPLAVAAGFAGGKWIMRLFLGGRP